MKKKNRRFKGLAVSPGISFGRAFLIESQVINFPKFWILDRDIPQEVSRFKQALKKIQQELTRIKERLAHASIGDQMRIIETHQMIANDETLVKETLEVIKQEKINSEWAFDKVVQKVRGSLPENTDSYFLERIQELGHVARRILTHLMGSETASLKQFPKNSILVAHDLSPTDTAQLIKGMVQGFITEVGGPTSHTAIVARAMEIPAVVGLEGACSIIQDGDSLLIDGSEGILLLHPTEEEKQHYRTLKKKQERLELVLLKETHLPSVTPDGYHLQISANMEFPEEMDSILKYRADGIGLFRTEMMTTLYKRIPTEEEQYQIYKKILRKMSPHPTTVRTFDMGGDKLAFESSYNEGLNPALGLRGIRYGLKIKDLLRNQIRALLRASQEGPLRIMIPMITTLEEIRQVRKIILETQQELDLLKIPFDKNIKMGVMIEVPSAAIMADQIAKEVDFLSIGTNDLIQYTLAVDRINEEVSYLYEPLHPSILRLLKMTAQAGRERNIEVSVCGEMAGNPLCFVMLLGLGLTALSLNPVSIPRIKKLSRLLPFRLAQELLEEALNSKTASEVESLIRREVSKIPNFPLSFS